MGILHIWRLDINVFHVWFPEKIRIGNTSFLSYESSSYHLLDIHIEYSNYLHSILSGGVVS
jgi:hypothetical protein